MAGITKEQAEAKLQTWMEAEEKIASGQGYSIGDRRLTRADLYTVRGEIEYWNNKVKELEVAGERLSWGLVLSSISTQARR